MLGGAALKKLFAEEIWHAWRGGVEIDPLSLIGPNSVDVTLGSTFLICENRVIDTLSNDQPDYKVLTVENGLRIEPGHFFLGHVNERFDCTAPYGGVHYTQTYEGRSTLGRLGIGTHVTAGFGDYGFQGCFTLEIFNVSQQTIILHPGMRIGQVAFIEVVHPTHYKGAYCNTDHYNSPKPPVVGDGRF